MSATETFEGTRITTRTTYVISDWRRHEYDLNQFPWLRALGRAVFSWGWALFWVTGALLAVWAVGVEVLFVDEQWWRLRVPLAGGVTTLSWVVLLVREGQLGTVQRREMTAAHTGREYHMVEEGHWDNWLADLRQNAE